MDEVVLKAPENRHDLFTITFAAFVQKETYCTTHNRDRGVFELGMGIDMTECVCIAALFVRLSAPGAHLPDAYLSKHAVGYVLFFVSARTNKRHHHHRKFFAWAFAYTKRHASLHVSRGRYIPSSGGFSVCVLGFRTGFVEKQGSCNVQT